TLGRALDDRAHRYAAARAATLEDYRRGSDRHEPRILLLVDGFGAWRSHWETDPDRAAGYADLLRVLAEGRALGVHGVLSAERPGALPPAVAAHVGKQVILRQSEESAYLQLGAP